jgi:hypothetical protein
MKHIMHFIMTALLLMIATACSDLYTNIVGNQAYMFLDRPVLNDLSISATDTTSITLARPELLKDGIPWRGAQAYIGLEGSITLTGSMVNESIKGPVDVTERGYTFTGLAANTLYHIIVVADNHVGYSAKAIRQKTGDIAPVLNDLRLTSTYETFITLARPTFSVAGNPLPTVYAYIGPIGLISVSGSVVSGSTEGPVDVSAGGYTFNRLTRNTNYHIIVVASNSEGYSVRQINQKNNLYYIGKPIYYNQCEDEDDFFNPDIGSEFGPKITHSQKGDAAGWRYTPSQFNNGLQVWNRNKTDEYYARAWIYPFSETPIANKPDLSRGTCAFWTSANGEWRHEGNDTDIYGEVLFYLAENTYFKIRANSNGDVASVEFFVQGSLIAGGITVRKKEFIPIIIQWDLVDGFSDGTNVRFYCKGNPYSVISTLSPADINNYVQYFYLQSHTNNGGDHRPATPGYGSIDNIIFWNTIVDVSDILKIE